MLKLIRFRTLALVGGVLLVATTATAETPIVTDGEIRPDADAARQLLIDTAARDDLRDLEAAETALSDAQQMLDDAVADGADPAIIESLTEKRDAAVADVDAENLEAAAVLDAVAAMSDQQVVYTNRALNNSLNNKTLVDLDAATLEDIVARDLNGREIQALTKALEEDAKSEKMAARFEQKYDETGREQFLRNRDRALDRGDRQRAKFDAKVDRSVARRESREEMRSEARKDATREAKASARNVARQEAKSAAREEARREGRKIGRGRN